MKIYKVLGKRGRITIPLEIRQEMGFAYNDVVSFENNGDSVLVRREKVCDSCVVTTSVNPEPPEQPVNLLELLDSLSLSEQRSALIHLSVKWAEIQAGSDGGS